MNRGGRIWAYSTSDEMGLLGLAFDPDFATNGFFYVNYTDLSGNTMVSRFAVTDDPNVADAASATSGVMTNLRPMARATSETAIAFQLTAITAGKAPPRRRESRYPVNLPILLWTAKSQAELAVPSSVRALSGARPSSQMVLYVVKISRHASVSKCAVVPSPGDGVASGVGVGAGVRWKSPVGPVEAAVAWANEAGGVLKQMDRQRVVSQQPR